MDTVSLRITLRYKDLDEFVKRYAENISSAGLFLRTRAPKPTGTKIRFELLLADGVRALRGEGVVVTVREDDKPGMALRFNVLDAESRAVVDRIVKAHGQGSLAPTPLATSFGRDGAAPEVAAPPASGAPAWRAKTGRGWSSMGAPPSRSSSSVGPGGLLPRRPSRAFGVPEPTLPRPEPLPERGPVLPRSRSELPRPWAAAPLPGAPMDEDERTQRLDVDKLPEVMRSLGAAVPQDVGVSEPEADDDVAATDERLEAGLDAHEAELGADGDEDEGAIVEAELHEAADADADDEAGELRGDDEAAAGAELPGDDEAAADERHETELRDHEAAVDEAELRDREAAVDEAELRDRDAGVDEAELRDHEAAVDEAERQDAAGVDEGAGLHEVTARDEADDAEEGPAAAAEDAEGGAAGDHVAADAEHQATAHDAAEGADHLTAAHDAAEDAEDAEAGAQGAEATPRGADDAAQDAEDHAAAEHIADDDAGNEAEGQPAPHGAEDDGREAAFLGAPDDDQPALQGADVELPAFHAVDDEELPAFHDVTNDSQPAVYRADDEGHAAALHGTVGDDAGQLAGADEPDMQPEAPAWLAAETDAWVEAPSHDEDDRTTRMDISGLPAPAVAWLAPEDEVPDAVVTPAADDEDVERAAAYAVAAALASSLDGDAADETPELDLEATSRSLDDALARAQALDAGMEQTAQALAEALGSGWASPVASGEAVAAAPTADDAGQVLAEAGQLHDAPTTALDPTALGLTEDGQAARRRPTALSNSWGEEFAVAAARTDHLAALDPTQPPHEAEPAEGPVPRAWLDEETLLDTRSPTERLAGPPPVEEHDTQDQVAQPMPESVAAVVVDTASALAEGLPETQDNLPLGEAPFGDDDGFDAALESFISAASAQTAALPPEGLAAYAEHEQPPAIAGPSEDVGPQTELIQSGDFLDKLEASLSVPVQDTPWPDVNENLLGARYRAPTRTGTEVEVPADVDAQGPVRMAQPRQDTLLDPATVERLPEPQVMASELPIEVEADPERWMSTIPPGALLQEGLPAPAPEDAEPTADTGAPEVEEAPAATVEDAEVPLAQPLDDEEETRAADEPEVAVAVAQALDDEGETRVADEPQVTAPIAQPLDDEDETRAADEFEPQITAPIAQPLDDEDETRAADEPQVAAPIAQPLDDERETRAADEPEVAVALAQPLDDEAETRVAEPDEVDTRPDPAAPRAHEEAATEAALVIPVVGPRTGGSASTAMSELTARAPGVQLEAATEMVKAYEVAPERRREATPMFSTEVRVTGVEGPMDPAEGGPRIQPHVEPPAPVEEPEEAHKTPDAMLRRAREAAFSEEATEVPATREQATAQVRPRAPARERRASSRQDLRAHRVVGLELGRNWVRVGLMEHGDLELIGAAGSPYVPAVVALRNDGTLVAGVKAQAVLRADPERAVRPIAVLAKWRGQHITDDDVAAVAGWQDGQPMLRLGNQSFSIREVLEVLLLLVRTSIVRHLGAEHVRVVVGLPAELDPAARRVFQDACREVGLEVLELLTEAEAVLRAYNIDERPVDRALVLDVGASHLGVALARRGKTTVDVVAYQEADAPCARTLDEEVAEMTLEELRDKAGEDHTQDLAARARLVQAVEHARPELARVPHLDFKVQLAAPGGAAGVVLERSIRLPRSRVYQATEPVVMEMCVKVQDLLRRNKVDPRDLQAVLLCGSAGQFPPLIQALQGLTNIEPLVLYPGPQVVLVGLARAGVAVERSERASREDALSASVGIELPGGRFGALVRAGTRLPARLERHIPTTRDNQVEVDLRIFQGDAEFVRACAPLGRLVLRDIPKGPRGQVRIDLELELDTDGVLTATLTEPTTQASQRLVIATAQTPDERRAELQNIPAVTTRLGKAPPKEKKGILSRLFGK